jgi:hypothetical protein
MARVKLGAIVSDLRGKLGGQNFQKNRYGHTLRTIPRFANKQSQTQQQNRGSFQFIVRSWGELTQGQRDAWNNAVGNFLFTTVFGDQVAPSGQLLFTRLNIIRRLIDEALLVNPPPNPPVTDITDINLIIDLGLSTLLVTYSPSPVPVGHKYMIYLTAPLSAGISNPVSRLRFYGFADAGAPDFVSTVPAYNDFFGVSLQVGHKVFVRAVPVRILSGVQGVPIDNYLIVS